VGVIHQGAVYQPVVDGLREGLRELGLEEGKQVVLDIRDAKGDPKAVEAAARDLERGKVDLIYTATTSVSMAVKQATESVPIVFYAGTDPVAAGLVATFAKPGGRLTGVHAQATNLTPKRLEILKEMIPKLGRVVTFYNPATLAARESVRLAREAGRKLGVQFIERHVGSVEGLRTALSQLKQGEVDAYFYIGDAMVASQAPLIIDTARAKRLPTMFHEATFVDAGALGSYGQNFRQVGRMSAKFVQRVLTGTPPRDMPVESYDHIELALNLRTAREIGLTIPRSLRLRADKLVE
jgi:putative ABC transport system substrate-binding protein